MTLTQYFTHLWNWLLSFPIGPDACCIVGVAGEPEAECIICGRVEIDEDEPDEEAIAKARESWEAYLDSKLPGGRK